MNKTEAILRVAEIDRLVHDLTEEAAALRSIIEAPESEKKPLVQAKDKPGFPILMQTNCNGFTVGFEQRNMQAFETVEQARAYAEAFNTLLDLRRQPGSEAAEDEKRQWLIRGDGDVEWFAMLVAKIENTCPCFDSKESAEAARDAVGLDRVLKMYNTLHGRYE